MTPASFSPDLFAATAFYSGWGSWYLEQLLIDVAQFLFFAGVFYFVFYVALPRVFFHRKVQEAFPAPSEVRREILLSLQSVAIFATFGFLIVCLYEMGWTRLYLGVDPYGWTYLFGSILLVLFIQDTWFYWVHRFLHWPPIYKTIHHVHHKSHNPTPWAAFSFHPLEAALNAMIFPIVIVLIPLNLWAEWIWFIYMFFISVYLHLGYEIMPRAFVRNWFYRWSTSVMHHNMHHTHIKCNYGLYFTIWDWLMSTKHPDYERLFEEVTSTAKISKRAYQRKKRHGSGLTSPRKSRA